MAEQKALASEERREVILEPSLSRLAQIDAMIYNRPELSHDRALQLEKLRILYDLGLVRFSPP